ncbi:MAG: hypothetical protein IKP12_02015, partial [Acholeplasmatales bacterium]|nr:hypothetical protein [Acholeplasmatales bacterium]
MIIEWLISRLLEKNNLYYNYYVSSFESKDTFIDFYFLKYEKELFKIYENAKDDSKLYLKDLVIRHLALYDSLIDYPFFEDKYEEIYI